MKGKDGQNKPCLGKIMSINIAVTATFGLEASVKRELNQLGYNDLKVSDGSIEFVGEWEDIPRLNINLRCASRVLVIVGRFTATTFTELFDKTKALDWQNWISEDANFIINGKSVKSTLFSIRDCQSITEKAIIEKLKTKYNTEWFKKCGSRYNIQFSILKDVVTLTLDTTGAALYKRGYRSLHVEAPLKETLAAALIELSFWKKDRVLIDCCCGSGTIAIEAAMKARNIAPGIMRGFDSEHWALIPKSAWKEARQEAKSRADLDFMPEIYASDIDENAIRLAKENARRAGVDDCIKFEVKPMNEVVLPCDYGVCITNPPYAERMGDLKEVEQLYRDMGKTFGSNKTWSFYAITSLESFEQLYGRKADKKRKLYNGNVKVDYYQFYGERPPKK